MVEKTRREDGEPGNPRSLDMGMYGRVGAKGEEVVRVSPVAGEKLTERERETGALQEIESGSCCSVLCRVEDVGDEAEVILTTWMYVHSLSFFTFQLVDHVSPLCHEYIPLLSTPW